MPGDRPARVSIARAAIAGTSNLEGDGTIRLLDDAILLETAAGVVTLELESIRGVMADGEHLEMFGSGDASIRLEIANATAVAAQIEERAITLPEVALALRAFGSRRGQPGTAHDRFFAPVLEARRTAENARTIAARLAAFDAERLQREAREIVTALAAAREPSRAPHRRALTAQLLEYVESLGGPLGALQAEASRVLESAPEHRLSAWRLWTRSLRLLFEAWDRCWLQVAPRVVQEP